MTARMTWRAALLALLTFAAVEARAQEAPSAESHFRSYEAALQRGDLIAAEASAAQALALADQPAAESSRTTVLAFNLARVRAALGQWQQALAPAQRAYDASRTRGAASGVDPLMARLLWGRVRVAVEGFPGAGFLGSALEDAEGREDLLGDRYDAANDLGMWAMQMRNFGLARTAWRLASDASRGAAYDARYARGRALAYEGMAISLQSVTRDPIMRPLVAREARDRFAEAQPLIHPFAIVDAADGARTEPQALYAQLLAWDEIVWTKMASQDFTRRGIEQLDANPRTLDGAPVCALTRRGPDGLAFPLISPQRGQIGAVVLRIRFGPDGAHLGTDVAAAVGNTEFEEEVNNAVASWTFAPIANDPEGCGVPSIYYFSVTFGYRP